MKKRILAGLLSAMMICSIVPVADYFTSGDYFNAYAENSSDSSDIIFSTDFEDGDVSAFSGRGGVETIESTTEQSHSGSASMCVSDRTKGWHGPQLPLDGLLEPGTEYIASAWVKADWYNDIKMSMEYTDSSGTRHFTNLKSAVSQGDWVEISEVKFNVPKNVTNPFLYFECNDGANIYIDDFEIKTAPVYDIQYDIASLKDVYSSYFKIGGAVTTSELAIKGAQNLIKKHYNSITPGNELKPDALLDKEASLAMAENGDDTNPQINISGAREILDFCRDNNISVRGHVLVWHSQTPDWFFKEGFKDDGNWVSKELMLTRMENYIKNVFETFEKEYPTVDFYAWDVVNEAFLDNGSPRTGGSQSENSNYSPWVKIFGDNSFIEPAFEYTRKYAPEGCMLYYNDFNEYMPQKTTAMVDMANDLKEKGLIDGIGMQSHLDVGFPTASAYKKALKAFAETGLDIQVTELDITTSDSESGFNTQAQLYSDIMDACVEYSDSISAVVFWGTTDDKSWRSTKFPLLFNEDFTAKPAYYSIIDGIEAPEYEIGDLNKDGSINVADAVLLQKYLINTIQLDESQYTLSDINQDDEINVFDFVLLRRMLLL